MYSNIYFDRYKSEIHYWEYQGKNKVHQVVPAPLYFFIEGNEEDESCDYKTIFGKPAKKLEYSRWNKYKADREKYKEWGRKLYESDVPIETKFIIDNYHGMELKMPNLDIHYLDIEVHSEEGFPRAEDARFPITIITTWSTKHNKFFIFAEKDFDDSFITNNKENFEKKIFKHEKELLEYYSNWVRDEHPDILSGWNCLEGNQSVWLADKIVPISKLSYSYKNKPLKNSDSRINKFEYTGEKKMYIIKNALGSIIKSSADHKFFLRKKNKSEYRKFSTLDKSEEFEENVSSMIDEHRTKDIYMKINIGNNENKRLTYRDILEDEILWNKLLENPFLDFPIKNSEIIKKARCKRNILPDYCHGKNFWKKSFEWNYKNNKNIYCSDILRKELLESDLLDYSFKGRRKNILLDSEISNDILQLIGFIFTDGSWDDKRNSISLYQSNKEILDEYSEIIKKQFNPKSITVKKTRKIKNENQSQQYVSRLSDGHLGFLLSFIYDFNNNKKQKNTDITLLSKLSKEQFYSYICGCYDGDGQVCNNNTRCSIRLCNFDCVKFNYLQNIQELLLWNGCLSSINSNNTLLTIIGERNNKDIIEFIKKNSKHKKRRESIITEKLSDRKNSSNKKLSICLNDEYEYGYVKITEIKETSEVVPMYDLETTDHTFITSGYKTHNCNGYDIPYIMNRIKNLLGEDYLKKISPVDNVYERMVPITKYREEGRWNIGGIYTLDLMEIYKNYTFSEKESWKLDDVAYEELGERKVEYSGTLADLYNNDWQKYVEYNIQDVRLLKKMEDKKKFIPLLVTFCYGCRVPLDQYQKTTRVLDGAFISALKSDNIVLPDVNRDIGETEFVGGFVKNPKSDIYDWVVSFDATSLYPSIMMNLNISPETKVGKIPDESVKVVMKALTGTILDENVYFCGETFTCQQFVDFIKDGNYCMSANGVIFRQDIRGIIPRFVEEWFNKRKEYKKKMIKAQSQGNNKKADEYYNLQLNFKILINSVFGFLGTKHSRFFDKDSAIAITLTGRYITITSAKTVNHYFKSKSWQNNILFNTDVNDISESRDVVIYADTDSVVGNSIIRLKNDTSITIEELMDHEINKNFNNYKINYDGREFVFPEGLFLPYYCELNKKIKFGRVKYVERHYSKKDIFRIRSKSCKHVDVTEDHTCMILDNSTLVEIKPKNIIKGQKIIKLSDQEKFEIDEVESVEFLNNDEQYVFDIGMEDTPHTFFANDILVHNSVYIDFGKILKSLKFDYKQYSDEAVKNYIIYNQALSNDELNIPHDFDLDSMQEVEKDQIIQRLRELEEAEVNANSLQNHVSSIINNAMQKLMIDSFNTNTNRISFKREAVAVRGLFLEKKRYCLWALNNEGVELPEKKRLKVTGIDIIRSTTPKFVKEKMKEVIINILKNVDYDNTIEQLKAIHDEYWQADPESIVFTKSANGIKKYEDKFKQDGRFKSTPQHIRGAILYNRYLDSNPKLKVKYDKVYDGDKVCVLYTKKGPEWDADVFIFKEKWLKESNFDEYIDRRRQFQVSMLNPIGKFFEALHWQLPDFENSDMSGLFEW